MASLRVDEREKGRFDACQVVQCFVVNVRSQDRAEPAIDSSRGLKKCAEMVHDMPWPMRPGREVAVRFALKVSGATGALTEYIVEVEQIDLNEGVIQARSLEQVKECGAAGEASSFGEASSSVDFKGRKAPRSDPRASVKIVASESASARLLEAGGAERPELDGPRQVALQKLLVSTRNIFLTGGAGVGKGSIIKAYRRANARRIGFDLHFLTVTDMAAALVKGMTVQKFFGTLNFERAADVFEAWQHQAALKAQATRRLRQAKILVIDEISMLSGKMLTCLDAVARFARNCDDPWGGLRIIAMGDFAQLPPQPLGGASDWAFLAESWRQSSFESILLDDVVRVAGDPEFSMILNKIRLGRHDADVARFLAERHEAYKSLKHDEFDGTTLYPTYARVCEENDRRLALLPGELMAFETSYEGGLGDAQGKDDFPIDSCLRLKVQALVMFRNHDAGGRWVNGTLAKVKEIHEDELVVIMLATGREQRVEKVKFSQIDAAMGTGSSAENFPLSLGWAMTISRSRGATIDRLRVDFRGSWGHGQVYVALSRVRSAKDIFVEAYDVETITCDPMVSDFYRSLPDEAAAMATRGKKLGSLISGVERGDDKIRIVCRESIRFEEGRRVAALEPRALIVDGRRSFGIEVGELRLPVDTYGKDAALFDALVNMRLRFDLYLREKPDSSMLPIGTFSVRQVIKDLERLAELNAAVADEDWKIEHVLKLEKHR